MGRQPRYILEIDKSVRNPQSTEYVISLHIMIAGVEYEAGDAMGVVSITGADKNRREFLRWYGLEFDAVVRIGATKNN